MRQHAVKPRLFCLVLINSGIEMRWLLSGCLLGGLGALLKYWQWPFAIWVSLAGAAVLALGFLNWLGSHGRGAYQASGDSGDSGVAWMGSSDHDCGASGDGGGGDGGCGGD